MAVPPTTDMDRRRRCSARKKPVDTLTLSQPNSEAAQDQILEWARIRETLL